MIRRLAILALFLAALPAMAQTLAHSCSNSTANTDLPSNQMACTLSSTSTDRLLVVFATSCADSGFLACSSTPRTITIADGFGLSWTNSATTANYAANGGNATKYMWWALTGSNSGNDTITLTYSGTAHLVEMQAGELTNVLTTSPQDGSGQANTGSGCHTTQCSIAVTTTSSSSFVVAGVKVPGGGGVLSVNGGGSCAARNILLDNAGDNAADFTTAAGAATYTMCFSSNGGTADGIVATAFKTPASATGPNCAPWVICPGH